MTTISRGQTAAEPPNGTMTRKNAKKQGQKSICNLLALSLFGMVHPSRLERETFYSGGRRSIQLSYGCITGIYYSTA